MVEPGDDDLVARRELPRRGTREGEVQGRHVGAKYRLVGRAAEPLPRRQASIGDERVGASARLERASGVRVRLPEVAVDRVDYLVGHLRPAGTVEEREARAERGEAAADGLDV